MSKWSTSYHGELQAIKLATDQIVQLLKTRKFKCAYILSDCQAAIQSVTSIDIHNSHQKLIDEIHRDCDTIAESKVTLQLIWIPGHVNLDGNEKADINAKEAARVAATTEMSNQHVAISSVKKQAKLNTIIKWQRAWDIGTKARSLYHNIPHPT